MKKGILLTLITAVLLSGLAVIQYFQFNDGKLHVIFCDVGQGDGIYIRTPQGKNLIIDGGPDRKILDCLAKHMPFWERTIDLMILTHPHADHFIGMHFVSQRYSITSFATEKLMNKAGAFQDLMKTLKEQEIPLKYVYRGDKWVFAGIPALSLEILGPTQEFLQRTSPDESIGDGKEFASLVSELSFGDFHMLFTGDTQTGELGEIADRLDTQDTIAVLQSPHHGSRTGLNSAIVQTINPRLVAISVGAKNRYKHPSKQTLDLLEAAKIPFLRTDKVGDIEIVSDGKGFSVIK